MKTVLGIDLFFKSKIFDLFEQITGSESTQLIRSGAVWPQSQAQ